MHIKRYRHFPKGWALVISDKKKHDLMISEWMYDTQIRMARITLLYCYDASVITLAALRSWYEGMSEVRSPCNENCPQIYVLTIFKGGGNRICSYIAHSIADADGEWRQGTTAPVCGNIQRARQRVRQRAFCRQTIKAMLMAVPVILAALSAVALLLFLWGVFTSTALSRNATV